MAPNRPAMYLDDALVLNQPSAFIRRHELADALLKDSLLDLYGSCFAILHAVHLWKLES